MKYYEVRDIEDIKHNKEHFSYTMKGAFLICYNIFMKFLKPFLKWQVYICESEPKNMEKDLDMKLYNQYLENNETNAFEMLYLKYKDKLKYFIYNIVKDYDKAEDIVQETFMYILQNKIDDNYSFKFHIYLVAKSKALSYINTENRRSNITNKFLASEDEKIEKDVADLVIKQEEKGELLKAIDLIDEKYRNAIYLVKIEGLSCNETSEILGESVQSIKNHIHRGKNQLRKILIKKGFDEMSKLSKIVVIVLCLFLISGIVYAATYYITNVWKEPVKFNYEEEVIVTENDKQEALAEEVAITKAKEILEKLGYEDITFKEAELVKYPDRSEMRWDMMFENGVAVDLDAYTGRFKGFSDTSIDDMKVKSTFNKEQAEEAVKEMYNELNLGYGEEYILVEMDKVLIEDESPLWRAYFCKIYDGIINNYESIRLTIIPETKQLWGLNVFDYKTENNPQKIDKNTAIQIAKTKAKEIRNGNEDIKEILAELTFEKMNPFIYSLEQYIEKQETEEQGTKIQTTDDIVSYRTEQLVRKVWSVRIKYNNEEFADEMKFYVDAEAGEIIGGDATK